MFYRTRKKMCFIAYLAIFAMLMAIMPMGAWAEDGDLAATTYEFDYTVRDDVIAGESYTVPVTIKPKTEGDYGYDSVRFTVEVTTPGDATLQLLAEDTNGVEHDVAAIGYWGPSTGFPIGKDYSATTNFTAIFSDAGEYTITFSLVDLDSEGAVIVTETLSITARDSDDEAPTTATNLALSSKTSSSIGLTWTASTDNVGVNKYVVEMKQGSGAFAVVGEPTNAAFTKTGLSSSTMYVFRVKAVDAAGNESAWSEELSVTTKSSSGSSGSGGGGGPVSSDPSDSPVLDEDSVSTQTTTDDEGRTVQTITVKADAVDQVEAAKDAGETAIEIRVEEIEADIAVINVPDAVLAAAEDMDVVITTPNASLELPKELVQALADAGQDLSIQVERGDVGEVRSQMSDVPGTGGAEVLGTPTCINTEIQGPTNVTIPLTGIKFPADPQEREDFLDSLAVFAIHSDGEKKVINGEIVFDGDGNPTGIKFEVDKFSTFAVIKTLAAQKQIRLTVGERQVAVDGALFTLDAVPFIDPESSRTLVPVRFVSEALGANVDWEAQAKQVIILDAGTEIVLTIGSDEVRVDGDQQSLDCPAAIVNDRTFVPLRFVSETLGADVVYDNATKEITIKR